MEKKDWISWFEPEGFLEEKYLEHHGNRPPIDNNLPPIRRNDKVWDRFGLNELKAAKKEIEDAEKKIFPIWKIEPPERIN